MTLLCYDDISLCYHCNDDTSVYFYNTSVYCVDTVQL